MTAKISVIVPVYNVEKYIRRCLDSLVNQSFKEMEIILVDDCSTDQSLEICKEYQQTYENVIVVQHEKNKGISATRNTGIRMAQGEYIGFIDSDDWVDINMYEEMYTQLINNKVDIVICAYNEVVDNQIIRGNLYRDEKILAKEQLVNEYLKYTINSSVWNKLFKKSLFINNEIYFPEGKIYEEQYLTYELLKKCSKIKILNKPFVFYNRRPESYTTSKLSTKHLDALEEMKKIKMNLVENNEYDKYGKVYSVRCYRVIQMAFVNKMQFVKSDKEISNSVKSFLRKSTNGYWRNSEFNYKNKIDILLMRNMFNTYMGIRRIINRVGKL